jgi:hypothetical protein
MTSRSMRPPNLLRPSRGCVAKFPPDKLASSKVAPMLTFLNEQPTRLTLPAVDAGHIYTVVDGSGDVGVVYAEALLDGAISSVSADGTYRR